MYVQLASGGYRAISQYNGFAVVAVTGGWRISDLAGTGANELSVTYATESDAEAALSVFMGQFSVVAQPAAS